MEPKMTPEVTIEAALITLFMILVVKNEIAYLYSDKLITTLVGSILQSMCKIINIIYIVQ